MKNNFVILCFVFLIFFFSGCGKVAEETTDSVKYVEKGVPLYNLNVSDVLKSSKTITRNSTIEFYIKCFSTAGSVNCTWFDGNGENERFIVSKNSQYVLYKIPDTYEARTIKVVVRNNYSTIEREKLFYFGYTEYCDRFLLKDTDPQIAIDKVTKKMWPRNGLVFDKPLNYAETEDMIAQLNARNYLGYNDWRLPTYAEFENLVGHGHWNMGDFGDSYKEGVFYNYDQWFYFTYSSPETETVTVIQPSVGQHYPYYKDYDAYFVPVRDAEWSL